MRNNGFTLIEVLIAVFVLAIGILGVAGLQLFAKQNNYDAIQRTTAATLASDMVERMRMNPDGLASYISSAEPISQTTTAPTTCDSDTATCTSAQLAAYDLQLWYSNLIGNTETLGGNSAGGLVAPSACITNPGGANEYQIAIAWRGRSALSNPVNTCGQAATGSPYGASNEYRRVFVIDATIE